MPLANLYIFWQPSNFMVIPNGGGSATVLIQDASDESDESLPQSSGSKNKKKRQFPVRFLPTLMNEECLNNQCRNIKSIRECQMCGIITEVL
jgi:hypothetical protein